jgi:hypothetical protein
MPAKSAVLSFARQKMSQSGNALAQLFPVFAKVFPGTFRATFEHPLLDP